MKDIVRPEKFAAKIYANLTKSDKVAFIGAVLIGVLTHLYVFTNKQYNIDELSITPGGIINGIELNRWFYELMGKASSRYMGGHILFRSGMECLLFCCFLFRRCW